MNSIKERLLSIVGDGYVDDSPETLDAFSRDNSLEKGMRPWFAVKPANTDEVRRIIKLAGSEGIPLVPVSSGAPRYRGDTVPSAPGAVIVNLERMNRILNINRQHRIVIVEPGVTYPVLNKALAEAGMMISMPLAPRKNKSVLTSVLEVEPRMSPLHQWTYIEPLRCTEVTWGDGNTMFTGEAGAGAPDLETQWKAEKWQVNGMGPQMMDFHRLLTAGQGSMGIVTWASLKCELLTQARKFFFVPSKELSPLTEFMYKVIWSRFGEELFLANAAYFAMLLGETPAEIEKLKIPDWSAFVGIAGRDLLPELRVETQTKDISDIAKSFGVELSQDLAGISAEKAYEKMTDCNMNASFKDTYTGAFQEIFFVTTLDKTKDFIDKMNKLAEKSGYDASKIGVYIQPMHMGVCCHLEFVLPYDKNCADERDVIERLHREASRELSQSGAFFQRPYGKWSELQYNKDAGSKSMVKKLKNIFDPNNIMNTGKLSL